MRNVFKVHFTAIIGASLLAACATVSPPQPAAMETAPEFRSAAGLVIGTLSYPETEPVDAAQGAVWMVHLERLDAGPERPAFVLWATMDPETHSGVFTGTLPAGMYSFREVQAAAQRYLPAGFRLPFEVRSGAVQDAGHYRINGLRYSAQAVYRR